MDTLLAPIEGATHQELGGITIDSVPAANGRLKRLVYPPGFRWSTHLKPLVGTALCMHAHVGFLARGHIQGAYADGCTFQFIAPQVVVVEPGHDAWVVGEQAAVLIQFDAEGATARRFGLPETHQHGSRPRSAHASPFGSPSVRACQPSRQRLASCPQRPATPPKENPHPRTVSRCIGDM